MTQCKHCRSYAINLNKNGRYDNDPDVCDVCYWRGKAERLQARLDFILDFIKCDDIGDEDIVIGVVVDDERLMDTLLITSDCDLSGSMMDGWKCDWNVVIDKAIERAAEKARKSNV